VVEAVSLPQWLLNAGTDRHSVTAAAPALSAGVAADPHPSHVSPAHPGAPERIKRAGAAGNSAPATQGGDILVRPEGFESVVEPRPSGESNTSNDGRWVRAHLIAEPDDTLGTETTRSAAPPATAGSAARSIP
jgi:hypothetical protein